jgi:hypothetical protein
LLLDYIDQLTRTTRIAVATIEATHPSVSRSAVDRGTTKGKEEEREAGCEQKVGKYVEGS